MWTTFSILYFHPEQTLNGFHRNKPSNSRILKYYPDEAETKCFLSNKKPSQKFKATVTNSTVQGFLELMSYYSYGQETPHFHDA
jgi:hypothetical protein